MRERKRASDRPQGDIAEHGPYSLLRLEGIMQSKLRGNDVEKQVAVQRVHNAPPERVGTNQFEPELEAVSKEALVVPLFAVHHRSDGVIAVNELLDFAEIPFI